MAVKDWFFIPQRVILAIMAFFAIGNVYSMRVCFSVALTEMTVKHINNKTVGVAICDKSYFYDDDDTYFSSDINENKFDFSEKLQGTILSSFFWGYPLTQIPGGIIADKFGGKWILSLGILTTAIFTILTPVAGKTCGSTGLIIIRALMGFCEGPTFPATTVLLSHWVPLKERGKIGAFVYGGQQVGGILGNAASGVIIKNWGWEAVFYVWGVVAILWFIIFTVLCFSDPASNPYIKDSEKEYLQAEIVHLERNHNLPPVPLKEILTSWPVLVLIVAQFGHNFGFFIMTTDLPKYMADVLKFPVKKNGFYVALTFLVRITSLLFGIICDFVIARDYIKLLNARKLWTITSYLGPGIFMVAASYAGCNKMLVILFFTICMSFMGFWYSGMKLNSIDLSPNYAGTLMAFSNGIGATVGIITPILVAALTPNSNLQEWRQVFWITLGAFTFSSIIVGIFASADIQPWNEPDKNDNAFDD